MQWFVLTCLMLWARHGEGGAIKCVPEDGSCSLDVKNRDPDIADPSPLETECLAGTEWESNCHRCRCSVAGVAECSKQALCDAPNTEDPIRCKPNTTFQRDCNKCACLNNGLGLCTLKICERINAPIASKENLPKGSDCSPGSSWKSQCNDCVCSPEGLRFCTEKACPGESSEPLLRCAPHSLWRNECNTCWCTSDGRAMCTKIGCVGIPSELNFSDEDKNAEKEEASELNETQSRKIRAVPQSEPPKYCQPGLEFRMDCNKCLCNNEGQDFSCTRIDCTALNNNNNNGGTRRKRDVTQKVSTDCVPGSVFDQGCNVCRCTQDGGHATCTVKRCVQSKDNVTATAPESSFRCNPGEQFKQNCNDCSCSADGKSVYCTLRICDDELTP